MRLSAQNLDKTLLERTVAWAEQSGGCGVRQRRAALDSTPLFGAGRVEAPLKQLGHAWQKAVGLAAAALATSAEVIMEEAGLVLGGQSSRTAACELLHLRCQERGLHRQEGGGAVSIGSRILTSRPPPGALAAARVPLWICTTRSVIARPKPAPPGCGVRACARR